MNQQLYIYDCLTGKLRVSNRNFMSIGSGKQNVFKVRMNAEIGGTFALRNNVCRFFPHSRLPFYSINGNTIETDSLVKPNRLYLVVLSGGCFIIWFGNEDDLPDFCNYDPHCWYVYTPETGQWSDGAELPELLNDEHHYSQTALVTFEGLGQNAFRLQDMKEVADLMRNTTNTPRTLSSKYEEKGGFLCPSCLEYFRPDEALSIASHPSLKGDSILGEYAMARFTPTQFTQQGHPLDAMGEACEDYACPKCHYKLLPFYNQMTHHHVAIIGVPGSGKSLYLASLVHQMEREFPRDFGIPFRDANPEENAPLNTMRIRLFYSNTVEDFRDWSSYLKGKNRRKVYRRGMNDYLPTPFIYTFNRSTSAHSIILYNTEKEPTSKSSSLIEKDCLKAADAIFFIYDPTQDPAFRSILRDEMTPITKKISQQEQLLSDVEMHIRRTLNLPPGEKISTPLAIIVSKSDSWKHLLGPEPLRPAVRNGRIRTENIRLNSERIRDLIFHLSPQICTGAENISQNVRYFSVSSFGSAPKEWTDELLGGSYVAPESGKLNPIRVTEPVLWMLNSPDSGIFQGA